MIINFVEKFVYLAMPHTASRAVSVALLKLNGSTMANLPHHARLRDAQEAFAYDFRHFYVFYTVRHPGDWLVSRWLANGGKRADFPEWIRHRKEWLFGRFAGDMVSDFIRYENLEKDLKRVTRYNVKLNLDPTHVTPDKRVDWASYWTKEDAQWAENYFLDFKMYGYSMEPVYVN